MILVLFFLILSSSILVIYLLFVFIILFSFIQLEIKDFSVLDNKLEDKRKIIIRTLIFNKVSILKYKLNDEKMKNIRTKDLLTVDIISKLIKKWQYWKKIYRKVLKNKVKIRQINLELKIGLENAISTSYIIVLISTILSMFISRVDYQKNNIKYRIMPIYKEKKSYSLKLNGIINVKFVHIIYIIYKFCKKGEIKNERKSYRRSTLYCNG